MAKKVRKQTTTVDLNKARPGITDKKRPSVSSKKAQAIRTSKTASSKTGTKKQTVTTRSKSKTVTPRTRTSSTRKTKTTKSATSTRATINPVNSSSAANGPSIMDAAKDKFSNIENNGKLLLTRRNLIFGAIGAGVVVVGASGIKFAADTISNNVNSIDTLKVPKGNVASSETFNDGGDAPIKVKQSINLPYGSLAWANSSSYIACLIPTDKAKPLATVDIISVSNGKKSTLINKAIGENEGFEIYDVRVTDQGIIWTEVNVLQEEWHIYCSQFDSNLNINPVLVDKGNQYWESPTIAASEGNAYWQVLPQSNKDKSKLQSTLHCVSFSNIKSDENSYTVNFDNDSDIDACKNIIYKSNGRMSTPVYAYKDGAVITPRANSKLVYHTLTYLSSTGDVRDSVSLPQNMKPMEAGYGDTGFNFAFDAIYNYGEGISNLGTYTPLQKTNDYNSVKWMNFTRDPSCAPAWCNHYFIIRSSMAVCMVDVTNQTYWVLDRPNASDDYGDYLASSGDCSNIVTYANIFDQPVTGEERKYCSLRIWA